MATASLSQQSADGVVTLSGDLNRETLMPLWTARHSLMASDVHTLDVAGLERVDSPGLAMLVYLLDESSAKGHSVRLSGMTEKLQSLIALYNLQQIIQPYLLVRLTGCDTIVTVTLLPSINDCISSRTGTVKCAGTFFYRREIMIVASRRSSGVEYALVPSGAGHL